MTNFKIKPFADESAFFQADYSNLSDITEIYENGIFARFKISGTFTIYKREDIDIVNNLLLLYTNSAIPVIIYHLGQVFNGVVNFETNFDGSYNFRDLSVEITDEYTTFEKNKEKEYNILGAEEETSDLLIITDVSLNVETISVLISDAVTSNDELGDTRAITHIAGDADSEPNYKTIDFVSGSGLCWLGDTNFETLKWGLAKCLYSDLEITNVTGVLYPDIEFDINIELTLVQEEGVGTYAGYPQIAQPPDGTGNWVYDHDNESVPIFVRPPQYPVIWTNSGTQNDTSGVFFLNRSFTNNYSDIIYESNNFTYSNNKFRRLDKIIKFIVSNLSFNSDYTYLFDDSGAVTDSFYDFKTITGDDYGGNTLPLADLLIMPITDAIPNPDGTEKTASSSVAYLTFEQLMTFLNKLGFYYRLENRGITDEFYFILERKKNVPSGNGINLKDYNNHNYIDMKNRYNKEFAEYSTLKLNAISETKSFLWGMVKFYATTINKDNDLDFNPFVFDINDVRTRRENSYPDDENSMFVLLSTFIFSIGGHPYLIRKIENSLISTPLNNYDFCFENLLKNYISNLPEIKCIIPDSNNYFSIQENQLKKRKTLKIPFLPKNVNDIDISKFVKFYKETAQITNYSFVKKELTLKF